ncbi:hypothetical protein Tco_0026074 [Tanacetum coccineum]
MFRSSFRDGLRESVSQLPILTGSIILILVISSLAEVRLILGLGWGVTTIRSVDVEDVSWAGMGWIGMVDDVGCVACWATKGEDGSVLEMGECRPGCWWTEFKARIGCVLLVVLSDIFGCTVPRLDMGDILMILEMTLDESSNKSYEGLEVGVIEPNGNTTSSKVTWRKMIILFVLRSRQRYPW